LLLASARLSAKSVARYRRFGSLARGIFSATSLIAAQTREDAERFIAIGAPSAATRVVGNIKFDVEIGPEASGEGRELRRSLGGARPTWIAGSTHAGEEEQVLAAHETLRGGLPDALLLLAPRHPDRFEAVAELLNRRQLRFTRRSRGVEPGGAERGGGAEPGGVERGGGERGGAAQVVLVDTVGELESLYASADAAFVGGSLVPIGGHNLLEPAALGVPVLTGPYQSNGKDIARMLVEQGAALQVADARELAAALARLFADPEERRRMGGIGRHIVESNRGSVARLLQLIEPLLPGPVPPPAPAARPSAGC
jgi:3-deoxy-D-manno-octulosonic-acid transferase